MTLDTHTTPLGKVEKAFYTAVVSAVQAIDNRQLNEALATRLLNETDLSAYGQRITDTIAKEQGLDTKPLDVNMYGRTAAGATVGVTYTCQDTGEVYVLMARKYKDARDPSQGLGEFILPGGYMNPKPPLGAEENIAYDKKLSDTALRELREETGFRLPEGYTPKSLAVDSEDINNRGVHTINEFFHIPVVGTKAEMPPLAASDDIADLRWINLKQVAINPAIGQQPDGSDQSRYSVITENGIVNMRDLHGVFLEKAAVELNNISVQQSSQQPSSRVSDITDVARHHGQSETALSYANAR
jgi:ADP-ribose pyrophosphatase YjhB (NUDIX family)